MVPVAYLQGIQIASGPDDLEHVPGTQEWQLSPGNRKSVFCYAIETGSEAIPRVLRLKLNVGKLMYVLSSGQLFSTMFEKHFIFQNCVNRASVKKN